MTTENVLLKVSFPANEDLSDDQYKFVVLDATALKVRRPDAITDVILGVLQNAPESGEAASVAPLGCGGISKVVLGATLAAGALVGPEYNDAADAGKAVAAVATNVGPCGVLLEGGDEDELGMVLLTPMHKVIAEDLP